MVQRGRIRLPLKEKLCACTCPETILSCRYFSIFPGETEQDMRASVEHTLKKSTWGLKLHMLNVVRGSRLATEMPDYVPFESIDQYVGLVCDLLETIPPEITIHRLTADAPRRTLIAPEWSYMKRSILNGIHAELRRRGTRQGSRAK